MFENWNIYSFDEKRTPENRQAFYISKDELKNGDIYYGERLSDHDVDRKYLKNNTASEDETQFYNYNGTILFDKNANIVKVVLSKDKANMCIVEKEED